MKFFTLLKHRSFTCADLPFLQNVKTVFMRFSKIALVLLLNFCFLDAVAVVSAQRIRMSKVDASLTEVFREIRKQSGYDFVYAAPLHKLSGKININVNNAILTEVLDRCMDNQALEYEIKDNAIVIRERSTVIADRTITGVVYSKADQLPIPGATVSVKGTKVATQTNAAGKFSIDVPKGGTVLMLRSLGYRHLEVPIGNSNTYTLSMEEDERELSEIVVTAGGITRKARELGYANETVKGDKINQAKVTNVVSGLAGKVSGLQITTINNGVNPGVKVILRGNRSILGNNEALIVLDGVPVPSAVLSSLNADDVDNVSVLKGANASALYGSSASNGALIITTKKGSAGGLRITVGNSTQFEQLSFLPEFQGGFGSGAATGTPGVYDPIENQQYGPAYDGKLVDVGQKLEDGSIQQITYENRVGEKRKFFELGHNIQNNISLSSGNEKENIYFSALNLKIAGITPKDRYYRNTFRLNTSKDMGKLTAGFNVSYTQNRADRGLAAVYWNVFNTPSFIPITAYKDWKNNKFANPNGYANGYYRNPYYQIDNNRTLGRNDYLNSNIDLNFKPLSWLSFDYRLGINTANASSKDWEEKFNYTPYTLATDEGSKADIAGNVTDESSYSTRVNSDFFINIKKDFSDFTTKLIIGNNINQGTSKEQSVTANALNVPGVFNVSNRLGELSGSESNFRRRSYAVFGDLTIGYKDYLFVHATGRNDWVSILSPKNRSFFYPSADISFIPTAAIAALKDNKVLNFAKLRAGYSKVGQVNLGGATDFGAYRLDPTFSTAAGFPYGSLTALSMGNTLVNSDLTPEFTTSLELGIELGFLQNAIILEASYYKQKSVDQTLTGAISFASGFSRYLLNAGELSNNGFEFDLKLAPFRAGKVRWDIAFNYNYRDNKVISLNDGLPEIALTTGGNTQVYAVVGKPFPIIKGTAYLRDAENRIILNSAGMPSKDPELKEFGNTNPKHLFGMNTSLRYAGLTLAAVLEFRTGYNIYNSIGADLDFTGSGTRSTTYNREPFIMPNSSVKDANGNYVPNTSVKTPGGAEFWANSAANRGIGENYVTSGRYFKIREVTLSYQLPAKWMSKTKIIKSATIGLMARNLLTVLPKENIYTDPEYSFTTGNGVGINTNAQTPPTRFYGGNISFTF